MTNGLLSDFITATTAGNKKVWNQKFYTGRDIVHFEFTGRNNVQSIYKFSLPPQSVEITNPQRITETKTFGGSVIEDYGNDTISIVIQGTTANSDIRYYYLSGEKTGTGFDELSDFNKLLKDYGSIDELRDKKVKLYYGDFSCRVLVKNFTTKQTKDNPLAFMYTIELIGFDDTKKQAEQAAIEQGGLTSRTEIQTYDSEFDNDISGVPGIDYGDPIEAAAIIESDLPDPESVAAAVNFTEDVFEGSYPSIRDICASIREAVINSGNRLRNLTNVLFSYINDVTSCIEEVTSLGDFIVSYGIRLGLGIVESALSAIDGLVHAIDDGIKFFTDFADTYGTMASGIIERMGKTGEDIATTFKYLFVSSKEKAEQIRAEVQHTTSTLEAAVIPGGNNADDTIVPVYGSTPYTIKSTDTWDSIALEMYGDASLGLLLSTYNSLLTESADTEGATPGMPPAGSTINIPVLQPDKGFDGTNEVYNPAGVTDNYGHDIGLGSDGDFKVVGGDLGLTNESETLTQSILNRLSTAVGSRIRTAVYGIRTAIGEAGDTAQIVIASSVETTLLSDPRVKSVENISFKGNGDNLQVVVVYTDINNRQSVVGGTF